MSSERRAIHAYLSPEAHESWRNFADENGVSVSALLEAYAALLQDLGDDGRKAIVGAARMIDSARRRRPNRSEDD
jgi:hypothetical protein